MEEKGRDRETETKSVAEIEKECNLCRETLLRMCNDLKMCEHYIFVKLVSHFIFTPRVKQLLLFSFYLTST